MRREVVCSTVVSQDRQTLSNFPARQSCSYRDMTPDISIDAQLLQHRHSITSFQHAFKDDHQALFGFKRVSLPVTGLLQRPVGDQTGPDQEVIPNNLNHHAYMDHPKQTTLPPSPIDE